MIMITLIVCDRCLVMLSGQPSGESVSMCVCLIGQRTSYDTEVMDRSRRDIKSVEIGTGPRMNVAIANGKCTSVWKQ